MYNQTPPMNYPDQFSGGSDVRRATSAVVSIEPIGDLPDIPYHEAHTFGDATGIGDFHGVEAEASPMDAAASYDGVSQCGISADQLTLSFAGQVYVFDSVTADKVQKVLLILGGCEVPLSPQPVDIASRNSTAKDYPQRCTDPERAASLRRFYEKKQNRCFGKKIRYDVRREVAVRMNRKKGQFSSKTSKDSTILNAEDSRQDDSALETLCNHCGISSISTPMMRKGPDGPRTLCNACGLYWAQKGTLKNIPKRSYDNPLTEIEQEEGDDNSNFGTPVYTH